jgi:hypothetical protein
VIHKFNLIRDQFANINIGSGSGTASPATPRKRKGASGDEDGTPAKKKKAPSKKSVVGMPTNDMSGIGGDDDLPDDMAEFSKLSIWPSTRCKC